MPSIVKLPWNPFDTVWHLDGHQTFVQHVKLKTVNRIYLLRLASGRCWRQMLLGYDEPDHPQDLYTNIRKQLDFRV